MSLIKKIFTKFNFRKKSLEEKTGESRFVIFLIFILLLILGFNLLTVMGYNNDYKRQEALAKERTEPARLEITYINDNGCTQCFNPTPFIDSLRNLKVEFEKEDTLEASSKEAQAIIKKLNVEKIPTVLVKGDLEKTEELKSFWTSWGEIKENTFVLTQISPPYVKTSDGQIMGNLSVLYLKDSTCEKCANLTSLIISQFQKAGISITDTKMIETSSEEGKSLITQYQIDKIPTLIFPSETELYENLKDNWSRYGTIEPDGKYVMRNVNLPYLDLKTNQVIGMVRLTILDDRDCTECYDPTIHRSALKNLGLIPSEEEILDINDREGKQIVNKYSISLVPTIVLTPEAKEYSNLVNVWSKVGTISEDGFYIFREGVKSMGSYKDLEKNEVINPNNQTSTDQ